MVTHSTCPLCHSLKIHFCLKAIDHTVSKEEFPIWECKECTGRFTQRVPDQDEIGKYYKSDQYISHSNTRKGLINDLYHRVRSITLLQKKKLIGKISGLEQGSLLDVGAGTGFFTAIMRKGGWKVIGLEPDEKARTIASEAGIQLQSISELDNLQESFDIITLWHVLEHVHDVHAYLDKLQNLLKPDGKLLIAVPNFTSADASKYQEFWAAYDVPRHLYHFSPASMKKLLNTHGLTVSCTYPQWFDSFYVSLLSEQYKNGKPGLIRGGWNGLLSNIKALGAKERCSSVIYVAERGNK